jgi:molybdopterin synthase sulfur carrier subunit
MSHTTIRVKFFASLREQLGIDELELDAARVSCVRSVWQQASQQPSPPPNTLCAINMQYARFDDAVHAGDEVAFFPPVTGG